MKIEWKPKKKKITNNKDAWCDQDFLFVSAKVVFNVLPAHFQMTRRKVKKSGWLFTFGHLIDTKQFSRGWNIHNFMSISWTNIYLLVPLIDAKNRFPFPA